MPTWSQQFEDARAGRARRAGRGAASRISPICRSMVCSGLSEVIGSWKIMVMSLPRTSRSSRSSASSRSLALEQDLRRWMDARPDRAAAAGSTARSPTCPSRIRRPAPASRRGRCRRRRRRTARYVVAALAEGDARGRVTCEQERLAHRNVFRGSKASRTASPMKTSRRQHDGDDEEAGEAEPGRLQVRLALRQQLAERGRAGRQAEAEEVERGQRRDRAVRG